MTGIALSRTHRRKMAPAFAALLGAMLLWGAAAAYAAYDPNDPWALPPEAAQKGVKSSQFQNPDVCAKCHPKSYSEWTKSMHRQYGNAAFQWAFEQSSRDTNGKTDGFCPRCHSPIAVLGGEKITPGQYKQLSDVAQKGVQCDFCHTLDSVSPDWPGNGSFHVTPGNVKRGPLKDAVSPYHKTAYSELHAKADFCGMCHNVSHPGTNLQLESTYSEWLSSDYAKKNITCQDCHMPPYQGQASSKGPMRQVVHRHTFVGANVRGAEQALAIEDLRKAAEITVIQSANTVNYGDKITFTVNVHNKGAGHYLPTGITELRKMWVDFTVRDAKGNVVLTQQFPFNTVLEDASGVHDGSVPIWKAVKVFSDNRIGPNATESIPIDWKIPYSLTKGDLKGQAVLKYQSLPPEFAKQANLTENPIVEMAVAKPVVVAVRPSIGAQIMGVLVTGVFGISYLLPAIVLALWLVLTIWLIVVAMRRRSDVAA